MRDKVLGGLVGLSIGDALGVPVEFKSRAELKMNPVTTMLGYGTWNQPPGTWSDDSSLTFCLAESLCHGFNLDDIAIKFIGWYYKGNWTPHGEVFDVGNATREAIIKMHDQRIEPFQAGGIDEYSNGNGSLMRILPLVYYLYKLDFKQKIPYIVKVSSITHAHIRSILACCIYIEIASNLLQGFNLVESYKKMKCEVLSLYRDDKEIINFERILLQDISTFDESSIKSSGYVIDTLEASLWCLLTTSSYREAVLKAVNLGEDSDTIGAVTGGLAGIYYGLKEIPEEWIEKLHKKEKILALAEKLHNRYLIV